MTWAAQPEAAALLASCAADPPKQHTFLYRFGETQTRYIGRRVQRLRALHRAAMEAALDTPEFEAVAFNDEQVAIASEIARTTDQDGKGRAMRRAA